MRSLDLCSRSRFFVRPMKSDRSQQKVADSHQCETEHCQTNRYNLSKVLMQPRCKDVEQTAPDQETTNATQKQPWAVCVGEIVRCQRQISCHRGYQQRDRKDDQKSVQPWVRCLKLYVCQRREPQRHIFSLRNPPVKEGADFFAVRWMLFGCCFSLLFRCCRRQLRCGQSCQILDFRKLIARKQQCVLLAVAQQNCRPIAAPS